MTLPKDKHPCWFKLKLERRQLIRELPPESAVNVLIACLNFLETESIPESLLPIEKIAVSAFLPDLEEAWATYAQRVKNGSMGGAPKRNRNARKRKQPYAPLCAQEEPDGTEVEVEEDTPNGVDSSTDRRNGDAASGGGPPARFYYDEQTGQTVDRGEAWG